MYGGTPMYGVTRASWAGVHVITKAEQCFHVVLSTDIYAGLTPCGLLVCLVCEVLRDCKLDT